MATVVKCDICKETIAEDMGVYELKRGTAAGGPDELLAAHVCKDCEGTLDLPTTIHKLKSAGFIFKNARPAPELAAPNAPAPVDARLMQRIQGR